MRLSALTPVNDLLDDPSAVAARYDRDGCLLVRRALEAAEVAALVPQVSAVLRRWRVATGDSGEPRWTGKPLAFLDDEQLHDLPALTRLVDRLGDPSFSLRLLADRVCGHPMYLKRNAYLHLGIPDDPRMVTAPHQDGYAMTTTGDYRRLWIALTHVPFGDGGLAVAVGSHRFGRFPVTELPGTARRATIYTPRPTGPVHGVDPALVDDHWHTAEFAPGDALLFSSELLHRGLPATSDRIRVALAVTASGMSDPRPPVTFTSLEDARRHRLIREIGAALGLSDSQIRDVRADLVMTGLPVTKHTVRSAVAGDHSRWRRHAPVCRSRQPSG